MAKKKASIVPPPDLKKGRFLEILVEQFERYFDGKAVVKSPDKLPDHVTGEMRDVDVSLRIRAGTADVLVMIECRNRGLTEDVQWVEQVVTKRNDLQATKAMLVTNKPMSGPAQKKAKHYGILTRTVISSTTQEDLRIWFGSEFVGLETRHVRLAPVDWKFSLNEDDLGRAFPEGLPEEPFTVTPTDAVFRFGEGSEMLSINDIVNQQRHHFEEVAHRLDSQPGSPERLKVRLNLSDDGDPNKRFYFRVFEKELFVQDFDFVVEARIERATHLPDRAFIYRGDGDLILSKLAVQTVDIPGLGARQLTLVHSEGGPVQLTIEPPNDGGLA